MARNLLLLPLQRALIPVLCLFGFGNSLLYGQTWYTSDSHLHTRCGNPSYSAAELLGLMKQEGINVGSVLIWGGGWGEGAKSLQLDSVHFRGQEDDPVSEPNYIVHWDVEIARLPGDWHGHMVLLNVAQKDVVTPYRVNYPGQDYLLPNYQYVQSRGGIVGYAHVFAWDIGSYVLDGFGPKELPLDVALARIDFLASEIMHDQLYWLWYSMLDAGFHLPLLGDSDLDCFWPKAGRYHAAFPLPTGDTLTYTKFIEAVREGRTVIRRNNSPPDYLDIRVNGVGLGGEVVLPNQATTVNVEVDASSVIAGQTVELILDGNVIGSQAITNSLQTYQWSVPLSRSGWIAAKTTGTEQYPPAPGYLIRPNSDGAHTAATFVLLGGCPIRTDPTAARNWKGYLDTYYEAGVSEGTFGTSAAKVRQKVDEAKLVWERIAQEGEGSIAMDCKAGNQDFTINAGHAGAWFNPDTSGQGQLIDVEPEARFMFISWFTYTDAASSNPDQQHWYTAQGNYSGNTAELILYETLGGQFDDPQETSTNPVGTVTVSFSDCEQGQMVYSIDTDGREGTIPLQRLIPGSGNVCEDQSGQAAATTEAVDVNAGMDGAWVNEQTLGQGFLIDAHPNPDGGNFIFVAWFTYGDDTASGQRWLTAQGDFTGSTAEIDIYESTGGSFNDAQLVDTEQVGTMIIDFTDCSNAQLSYSLTDETLAGDMAISRLIPGGQALCEELAGSE